MGRPLKIQKYNNSVDTDVGYPNWGSLTNPVLPTGYVASETEFLGVVGGVDSPATSTTFPQVKVRVNIANSFSGDANGHIIRQKGSRKYLVATNAAIDPANAVVGTSMMIATVGNTDWQSMGAPAGAAAGTVFYVTAASAGGTTGTAFEVGQCVLQDAADGALSSGYMNITMSPGDSSDIRISKLTNKFALDYTGGPGYTEAEVVNDVKFAANFFSDEGTVVRSGAEQGTAQTLQLGQVESYT